MKFDRPNKFLNNNKSYRQNGVNTKLDINCICFGNVNISIFNIAYISHILSITNNKIFRYIGINYNLIKFIRKILLSGNIDKKI